MVLQIITNGILQGGIYALVSLGLTIIFGVMKIINFAHGAFLMISMYCTFWLFNLYGMDPYLSIIIVIPVMFIVGMVTYRIIIQPILDAPEESHVFATLGLNIALQGLAVFLWKADFRTVPAASYMPQSIGFGNWYVPTARLVGFGFTLVAMAALIFFLKKTFTGKAIRASAQNRIAAQLMGVNLKKIYMISFGIGLGIVGLAGAICVPIYAVSPSIGSLFVLLTFVVVILGGLGSISGALVGGFIVGIVESTSGFFLSPALKEGVYFVIFVIILLIKPTGIFGKS